MNAAVRRLFPWLVLAAGMALSAGCSKPAPADGTPATPHPGPQTTIPVTAEQLVRDYETDKSAADGKYKDRWLIVEGTLGDVSLFPSGRVLARVAGSNSDPGKVAGLSVRCEFVPAATVKVTDLTKGQKLTCKGKCAGATGGGFVDLTECELQEVGPDPTVVLTAAKLAGAFAGDEKTADGKYRGKVLLVEGTVRELKETDGGLNLVLEGSDEKALFPVRVSAACPAERKEEFAHLKKGFKVKIKGECGGNFLGEVLLLSARLVPSGPK